MLTEALRSLPGIHHTASSSPPSESGLQSYTFTSAVPRLGSTQRLIDSRNGFTVNTAFANLKAGSEWGARVEVVGDHGKERGTGVWYVSLEGPGSLRLVAQEGEAEVSFGATTRLPPAVMADPLAVYRLHRDLLRPSYLREIRPTSESSGSPLPTVCSSSGPRHRLKLILTRSLHSRQGCPAYHDRQNVRAL